MTLRELVDCLHNDVKIILEDRNNEKCIVYEGDIRHLRTWWHDEEVCWIRLRDFQEIAVEIESKIHPDNPDRCLYSGKHRDYECQCDECDHFLHCFPECDPDFRDDRYEAFRHALFETYPDTLHPEAEQAFLDAFQGYFGTENTEDLEWAKKQLRFLRENGLNNEELDRIAELAAAEYDSVEKGDTNA